MVGIFLHPPVSLGTVIPSYMALSLSLSLSLSLPPSLSLSLGPPPFFFQWLIVLH